VVAEPYRLFITGKTEQKTEEKKKRTLYSESSSNGIFRSICLPSKIDPDKVNATMKNGILEISMQKAAPAKKAPSVQKQLDDRREKRGTRSSRFSPLQNRTTVIRHEIRGHNLSHCTPTAAYR
jgi:hypothetical protein